MAKIESPYKKATIEIPEIYNITAVSLLLYEGKTQKKQLADAAKLRQKLAGKTGWFYAELMQLGKVFTSFGDIDTADKIGSVCNQLFPPVEEIG